MERCSCLVSDRRQVEQQTSTAFDGPSVQGILGVALLTRDGPAGHFYECKADVTEDNTGTGGCIALSVDCTAIIKDACLLI